MTVSMLRRDPAETERLPACSLACQRHRVYNEETGGLFWAINHNPAAHEQYGAAWALRRESMLVFRTGPLAFDGRRGLAVIAGRDVHLTPRECQMLACLGARLGEVVPYCDITTVIWHDPDMTAHAWGTENSSSARWHLLRVVLARLRAKLGTARRLIVTRTPTGLELLDEEPAP